MKTYALIAAALSAATLFGKPTGNVKITADRVAADNVTGALAASGHVQAVSAPVVLRSESVLRDAEGEFTFADPTHLTRAPTTGTTSTGGCRAKCVSARGATSFFATRGSGCGTFPSCGFPTGTIRWTPTTAGA